MPATAGQRKTRITFTANERSGRRVEEQIAVLRALWTQPVVTFDGKWHHIVEAGINPLPVQRPIPIWMGGSNEAVGSRSTGLAGSPSHPGSTSERRSGFHVMTPRSNRFRSAVELVRIS